MNSRNPLLRLYLLTALAPALNATAQSTWTNSAGGNWLMAANWTGGVPVSGGTTILNFTAAAPTASPMTCGSESMVEEVKES